MEAVMPEWLESELQRGLREVTAPPDLWDRVQGARLVPTDPRPRKLTWAMAATVILAAVALSILPGRRATNALDSQSNALYCQNPAQLRAWVRAKTGLDVPLRATLPASIHLVEARNSSQGVEIAYRAANSDAVLLVSRAEGAVDVPHSRVTNGNVTSWVMAGQRFTLASDDPADFQIACKLCHLD
jgi:hypothetical protein